MVAQPHCVTVWCVHLPITRGPQKNASCWQRVVWLTILFAKLWHTYIVKPLVNQEGLLRKIYLIQCLVVKSIIIQTIHHSNIIRICNRSGTQQTCHVQLPKPRYESNIPPGTVKNIFFSKPEIADGQAFLDIFILKSTFGIQYYGLFLN